MKALSKTSFGLAKLTIALPCKTNPLVKISRKVPWTVDLEDLRGQSSGHKRERESETARKDRRSTGALSDEPGNGSSGVLGSFHWNPVKWIGIGGSCENSVRAARGILGAFVPAMVSLGPFQRFLSPQIYIESNRVFTGSRKHYYPVCPRGPLEAIPIPLIARISMVQLSNTTSLRATTHFARQIELVPGPRHEGAVIGGRGWAQVSQCPSDAPRERDRTVLSTSPEHRGLARNRAQPLCDKIAMGDGRICLRAGPFHFLLRRTIRSTFMGRSRRPERREDLAEGSVRAPRHRPVLGTPRTRRGKALN